MSEKIKIEVDKDQIEKLHTVICNAEALLNYAETLKTEKFLAELIGDLKFFLRTIEKP